MMTFGVWFSGYGFHTPNVREGPGKNWPLLISFYPSLPCLRFYLSASARALVARAHASVAAPTPCFSAIALVRGCRAQNAEQGLRDAPAVFSSRWVAAWLTIYTVFFCTAFSLSPFTLSPIPSGELAAHPRFPSAAGVAYPPPPPPPSPSPSTSRHTLRHRHLANPSPPPPILPSSARRSASPLRSAAFGWH